MKFVVEREELAPIISWAAKLSGKTMLAALTGIHLTAKDGTVTVRAGNGNEHEGETSVPCEVLEEGSVLISGRLLNGMFSKLQKKPVTFESDGDRVNIKCGRSNYHLRLMPVEDYPASKAIDAGSPVTIPANAFQRMVEQVRHAASNDDGRPVLTGVKLEIEEGQVTAVATDSYRLAVKRFDHAEQNAAASALIPASTLADIAKTMHDVEADEVRVTLESNVAQFEFDDYRVTSNLIEGDFPNWSGLMPDPENYTSLLRFNRKDMLDAIGRVNVVAATGNNVPLMFEVEGGYISISTTNDGDTAGEVVSGEVLEGEKDFSSAYNPGFLAQALASTGAEFILLEFHESLKPAIVRPERTKEQPEDYRILVMPMRVQR